MAGNCFFGACCHPCAVRFFLHHFCLDDPFPGVEVTLYAADCSTVLATGTTDSDGWVDFGVFADPISTVFCASAAIPHGDRYLPFFTVYGVPTTTTKAGSPTYRPTPDFAHYVCDPASVCDYPLSKTFCVTYGGVTYTLHYTSAIPGLPGTTAGWVDGTGNYYVFYEYPEIGSAQWSFEGQLYPVTQTCDPFTLTFKEPYPSDVTVATVQEC